MDNGKINKKHAIIAIGILLLIISIVASMCIPTTCIVEKAYTEEYLVPVYKTVTHNDPVYEYTYFTIASEGFESVSKQISESGYLFIEKRIFDFETVMESYSNEWWYAYESYMSCRRTGNTSTVCYEPEYSPSPNDPIVTCNCKEVGIDKLICTVNWHEDEYENGDVYRTRSERTYTLTRYKEITNYNIWTEQVVDGYDIKERTAYKDVKYNCSLFTHITGIWLSSF